MDECTKLASASIRACKSATVASERGWCGTIVFVPEWREEEDDVEAVGECEARGR